MFPDLKEMKRIRLQIGWSQNDLAEKVGISQSAITKYENGTQIPSYKIATKIFEVLLSEEENEDPEVSDIMEDNVFFLSQDENYNKASEIMKDKSISQIPVVNGVLVVGTISESKTLDLLDRYHNLSHLKNAKLEEIMDDILPQVPSTAKLNEVTPLLKHYGAVLINRNGNIIGIITKADLLNI